MVDEPAGAEAPDGHAVRHPQGGGAEPRSAERRAEADGVEQSGIERSGTEQTVVACRPFSDLALSAAGDGADAPTLGGGHDGGGGAGKRHGRTSDARGDMAG